MRVLTSYELWMMTRAELNALQRHIAQELPHLAEGSADLRAAHANLQAIRKALTAPGFVSSGPRP